MGTAVFVWSKSVYGTQRLDADGKSASENLLCGEQKVLRRISVPQSTRKLSTILATFGSDSQRLLIRSGRRVKEVY